MNVKDVASGVALLAGAGAYYWATLQIADSSLSDDVGAQGLPIALAALLALVSAILIARGLVARPALVAPPVEGAQHESAPPRALGFLLIGVAYVVVAPLAGYVASIALLIAAVAVYEGVRPSWRLPLIAAVGSGVYWLLFVKLLGVPQPTGLLF